MVFQGRRSACFWTKGRRSCPLAAEIARVVLPLMCNSLARLCAAVHDGDTACLAETAAFGREDVSASARNVKDSRGTCAAMG